MTVSPQILEQVEKLYLSTLDAHSWYSALQSFAESIGGAGCILNPLRSESMVGLRPSQELTDVLEGFVAGGWHLQDHRSRRGWPLVQAGHRVLLEHDIADDDERRKLPFYREWAEPTGLPWWAAIALQVDGEAWSVPILRSGRQGPFTKEDAEVFRSVAPHLERVILLAQRFAEGQVNARISALERLGCGCFVLNRWGRVTRYNDLAEAYLGTDLSTRQGKLEASDFASNLRLQSLIERALRDEPPTHQPPVPVLRCNGPPLLVDAMNISSGIAEFFHGCTVIVMVSEMRRQTEASSALLMEIFGLTRAEARLAALVGAGSSPTEAASHLGISIGTVRTQLKAVFMKTDVHRQSELAALIARCGF